MRWRFFLLTLTVAAAVPGQAPAEKKPPWAAEFIRLKAAVEKFDQARDKDWQDARTDAQKRAARERTFRWRDGEGNALVLKAVALFRQHVRVRDQPIFPAFHGAPRQLVGFPRRQGDAEHARLIDPGVIQHPHRRVRIELPPEIIRTFDVDMGVDNHLLSRTRPGSGRHVCSTQSKGCFRSCP